MFGKKKAALHIETGKILDEIERAVHTPLKPYGFQKHGRTLHRFVSGDLSQVIHFQLGQAYRDETHLLFVNVGIRVPECMTRSFAPEDKTEKYYHEHECNIRSRLGEIEGKKVSCYDLRKPTDRIIADILRQIQGLVLPVFEVLCDRDAILARRRDYPRFDLLNRHLILLEEAMIYGRRGETEKAADTFNLYYHLCESGQSGQKDRRTIQTHLRYLDELAAKLGIDFEAVHSGLFGELWDEFEYNQFEGSIDGKVVFAETYNNTIDLVIVRCKREFLITIDKDTLSMIADEETDFPVEKEFSLSEMTDVGQVFAAIREFIESA